jgi:hypothetical protein
VSGSPIVRRRLPVVLLALLVAAALSLTLVLPAAAVPPNIPDASTAWAELDALEVAEEGSMSGCSRYLFPHWITISGTCNTREERLRHGIVVADPGAPKDRLILLRLQYRSNSPDVYCAPRRN